MGFFEVEPEILDGMKGMVDTQKLFIGAPRDSLFANPVATSWYGTAVDARRGAFAFVQEGSNYEDLIGEFVRVIANQRHVTVYCLGATPQIETPLALTRRAFLELSVLAVRSVQAYTQVLI